MITVSGWAGGKSIIGPNTTSQSLWVVAGARYQSVLLCIEARPLDRLKYRFGGLVIASWRLALTAAD